MNGKGDKWRGGWSQQYADNHNKIFGGKMNLVDYKGRDLEVGQRVRIEEDIPSHDGVLYKNQIVKLDEWKEDVGKIRVTDRTGKIWWIDPTQVSCSFL
tara:strand:- start:502 stop:795 length:294 start_codon:yes stop_codon:yes gene_type:complete